MTRKMPGASVTQNWQVGPSFKDSESTQTIIPASLALKIENQGSQNNRKLELPVGVHSFFLKESTITHIQGIDARAQFEINVLQEGSFFVAASKQSNATLNSKQVVWARLKLGDRIRIGDDSLICEPCSVFNEEKTLLNDGSLPSSRQMDIPNFYATPVAKGSMLKWGLASICGCVLAAILGYVLAQNRNDYTALDAPLGLQKSEDLVFETPVSPVQSLSADESLESPEFGEKEFLALIEKFRSGKKATACSEMANQTKNQVQVNIWTRKAGYFLERRCSL